MYLVGRVFQRDVFPFTPWKAYPSVDITFPTGNISYLFRYHWYLLCLFSEGEPGPPPAAQMNRSCFESVAMADPSCCDSYDNSTCPSKFRQDQLGEVRSRWVELSVERTNRSFLSVWQRSTSWRYSLCMAKGEKKCCEIFLWTCLQGIWKTLFHVPHAITSKKTVTWDDTTNCFQKTCLLRCVKTRGKKLLKQA